MNEFIVIIFKTEIFVDPVGHLTNKKRTKYKTNSVYFFTKIIAKIIKIIIIILTIFFLAKYTIAHFKKIHILKLDWININTLNKKEEKKKKKTIASINSPLNLNYLINSLN